MKGKSFLFVKNQELLFPENLSIINVSVQTIDIVEGLPKLEFDFANKENVYKVDESFGMLKVAEDGR